MLISTENIARFIPQRDPIVMIGNLLRADEKGATTNFTITENNIFVSEGCFHEAGLIENIAQTAMIKLGYECSLQKKETPMGYLAAIKKFSTNRLPKIGCILETTVTLTSQVFDVVIMEGIVRDRGEEICRCEIRIFTKTGS